MTKIVQVFQLASGCCVIGEVIQTSKDSIIVEHPLQLETVSTKSGFVFSARRWLPFNHENFQATIYKRNIVGSTETDEEIGEYYRDQVTRLTKEQASDDYGDDVFDSTFH